MSWFRSQVRSCPETPGSAAAPVMVELSGRVMVVLPATYTHAGGSVSNTSTSFTGKSKLLTVRVKVAVWPGACGSEVGAADFWLSRTTSSQSAGRGRGEEPTSRTG